MSVFDGGYIPSDSNIAVGPNHVVEVVNAAFAAYTKAGVLLVKFPLKNLWTNLTGSACAANNGGDTVVAYDRMADRWLVTQLGSLSSPYSECIAVSQTNDPTGAYYLYAYSFGSNLNDYPKWGVWPTATNSAYLATYNLFANGAAFVGAEICAYDRKAMLSGAANPAALCYSGLNPSLLPADLDGSTPPLDGTPAYFVNLNGSSLGVYQLTPNFAGNTASLTSSSIGVASYTAASSSPQPGTSRQLDSLSDRLMFRLAFRMFADHESMVVNHSVAYTQAGGASSSGVRWYELRSPVSTTGTFTLYQQGTFAPDSSYRWMGSAAMDQAGDIALGYSVSDGISVYPSIRYTGRGPTDTPGTMGAEGTIINGLGSQTGYTRWGDYTSMRIDPSDDCTFWYVNEYYPVTSSYGWYTRIGSFKFDNCGAATNDFSIAADPTAFSLQRASGTADAVTLTSINGYSSSVTLTATCPTTGMTCTLSPNPVTPTTSGASSSLAVSTTTQLAPGSYSLSVTGTDGSLTHSTAIAATITAPVAVTISPTSLTIARGRSSSTTVFPTTTDGGSDFPVSLGVSGLPNNVTGSFGSTTVQTAKSTSLKLSVNRKAQTGTYTVTVRGSGGGSSASTDLTLVIK